LNGYSILLFLSSREETAYKASGAATAATMQRWVPPCNTHHYAGACNCRFSRRNEEPCSSDGCFAPCPNYPRLVIQRSPVYFRTTKDLHP